MPLPPAVVNVAGFKLQFTRDWTYGKGKESVTDGDIQRGLNEAAEFFNPSFFDTQSTPIAYYYAAAHLMVLNVQAAGGLSAIPRNLGTKNRNSGVVTNKSAGQLSIQYGVSQSLIEDAILGQFMETSYGRRYLQMVSGHTPGHVITVSGPRDPGAATPNIPFIFGP